MNSESANGQAADPAELIKALRSGEADLDAAAECITWLVAQNAAAVHTVVDGSLIVMTMPATANVDVFAHAAGELHQRLSSLGKEVHMIVLENDTTLDVVDDDVMVQAGWMRAH